MSVDYDRLRTLVQVAEDYAEHEPRDVFFVAVQLKHVSLDTARELLRLHDGIVLIRDHYTSLAKSARAAGLHVLANEMYASSNAITELLDKDKA